VGYVCAVAQQRLGAEGTRSCIHELYINTSMYTYIHTNIYIHLYITTSIFSIYIFIYSYIYIYIYVHVTHMHTCHAHAPSLTRTSSHTHMVKYTYIVGRHRNCDRNARVSLHFVPLFVCIRFLYNLATYRTFCQSIACFFRQSNPPVKQMHDCKW